MLVSDENFQGISAYLPAKLNKKQKVKCVLCIKLGPWRERYY